MFFRRKCVIGLHLGSSAVTAALVQEGRRGAPPVLLDAVALATGEGQPLEEALAAVSARWGRRCRDCTAAFWPEEGMIRFFEHRGALGEVEALLKSRHWQLLAQNYGDFVFGCGPLPVVESNGGGPPPARRYVCCGMPAARLAVMEGLFARAKLKIKVLQLSPLAVFNAFDLLERETAQRGNTLLVDVGGEAATIVGGRGGTAELARRVPHGLNTLTERLILDGGISPEEDFAALSADDDINVESARQCLAELAKEIASSIDYFQTHLNRLDGLYFTGAVTRSEAVLKILGEMIRADMVLDGGEREIPFKPWNPLERLGLPEKPEPGGANWAAALGAAFQYLC